MRFRGLGEGGAYESGKARGPYESGECGAHDFDRGIDVEPVGEAESSLAREEFMAFNDRDPLQRCGFRKRRSALPIDEVDHGARVSDVVDRESEVRESVERVARLHTDAGRMNNQIERLARHRLRRPN